MLFRSGRRLLKITLLMSLESRSVVVPAPLQTPVPRQMGLYCQIISIISNIKVSIQEVLASNINSNFPRLQKSSLNNKTSSPLRNPLSRVVLFRYHFRKILRAPLIYRSHSIMMINLLHMGTKSVHLIRLLEIVSNNNNHLLLVGVQQLG